MIDALARASGLRYATHDVVGAGPRIVAGIIDYCKFDIELKSYELFMENDINVRNYDAVLISIMSSDKGALEKTLNKIVRENYNGLVIIGGPASFEYVELLTLYKRIDYVVIGEGEIPLLKILEKPDVLFSKDLEELRKIPALAFKTEKGYYVTSGHIHTPAETISLIKPWTRIEESYKFHKALRYYVEALRGCSNYARPLVKKQGEIDCVNCLSCRSIDLEKRVYCPANIPPGCGFCSVPYMFGPPRSRSINSIVEEVVDLIKHGARRIVLSAPDFLDYGRELLVKPKPLTNPCEPPPNVEMIEELLSELTNILSVKNNEVVVSIENIKACLVNDEVAKILGKYLKDTTIHIGLETGCDWYNDYVLGKPILTKQVINAVKLLVKYGLRPYIYVMYGLPLMNKRVYSETINTVKKLAKIGVEKITLYKYINLPATAFKNIKPYINEYRGQINQLKKIASRINREFKKKFLSRELEVYLVYSQGKYYGYPAKHGPVVFVKNINKPIYSNCKALVKIIDTGERFLWGELVKIISC